MDIIKILLSILSFLFVGLTSLVTWIYSNAQKDTQKRFDKNETRMDSIEENYLTRFEKLNNNLNTTEKNIIAEINKSKIEFLNEVYKIQMNSESSFQKKDACLVHSQEIKDLKKELEEVKKILMQ